MGHYGTCTVIYGVSECLQDSHLPPLMTEPFIINVQLKAILSV